MRIAMNIGGNVAGELSDGTVTWLAGPRTLSDDIVPALHEAAAAAGCGRRSIRPGPTRLRASTGPAASFPALESSA